MKKTSQTALRMACIFIAGASILAIGIQPVFMGLLSERLDLSLTQQSGTISAEMCGSIFGTLLCMPLMRRVGGRSLAVCVALLLLISNCLTAQATQFVDLMGLRFASGVASGFLYAYAVFVLGDLHDPDRSYGVLLFMQTALFASVTALLPMIAGRLGFVGAIVFLCFWFVLVCLACLCLPREPVARRSLQTSGAAMAVTREGLLALIGMVMLQVSIYSLWGYIDGIGSAVGIDPEGIGWALSIGLLGGLPGAALPSLLGSRLGRAPMILAGSALVLLANWLFATRIHSAIDLSIAVFLMNLGWNLALSYYMATVVTHDPSGRLTRIIGSAQVISAAIGPTLLVVLVGESGKSIIFLLSSAAIVFGCLVMGAMAAMARSGRAQVC